MSAAISVQNVTKTFGEKVAVRDLDLEVARGGLCGFIGPNGAGKTTTIRMIMSILFPDTGKVSVLGHASALEAKDRIGYLPEERGVYKKMKVASFLKYMARLKGADLRDIDGRIAGWLQRMELSDVAGKKCEELSKGMQQKIQFVATVIHEPDLIILDEPFSGLDPVNMRLLRQLIQEQHERGATVIFSTHVMIQAEEICERVVMIDEGCKVLDSTIKSIRETYDPRVIFLEPQRESADMSALSAHPAIVNIETNGSAWKISLDETSEPTDVIRDIVAAVPPTRIELHRPSLEDVFIQLVTSTRAASKQDVDSLRASLSQDGTAQEDAR